MDDPETFCARTYLVRPGDLACLKERVVLLYKVEGLARGDICSRLYALSSATTEVSSDVSASEGLEDVDMSISLSFSVSDCISELSDGATGVESGGEHSVCVARSM